MYPTLKKGDVIFVKQTSQPQVGDIVVLRLNDGSIVTHRVVAIDDNGKIQTKGDASGVDTFVNATVIGIVEHRWAFVGNLIRSRNTNASLSSRVSGSAQMTAATWDVPDVEPPVGTLLGDEASTTTTTESATTTTADSTTTTTDEVDSKTLPTTTTTTVIDGEEPETPLDQTTTTVPSALP